MLMCAAVIYYTSVYAYIPARRITTSLFKNQKGNKALCFVEVKEKCAEHLLPKENRCDCVALLINVVLVFLRERERDLLGVKI